jgi:transposase
MAKAVNPVYKELGITRIFNKAGSPDYNPIESVFSQVKRDYCRVRLRSLANDQAFLMAENIKKSFKKVTREICKNCIIRSEAKL